MTDTINHPPHYKAAGLETIDVIEAFGLGFRLGNVVKYVLRHGRKGAALVDLKKALWYLHREIAAQDDPETPAARVRASEAEIEACIARELKSRHCTSPDGTYVSASTDAVVRSVMAALGGVR